MVPLSVTFLGSTPVGGPIVGAAARHLGPRAQLALSAVACLAAAVLGLLAVPHIAAQHGFLEHRTARHRPPRLTETDRT